MVEDRQVGEGDAGDFLQLSVAACALGPFKVSAMTGMSQTLQEALLNYSLKADTHTGSLLTVPSPLLSNLLPYRLEAT